MCTEAEAVGVKMSGYATCTRPGRIIARGDMNNTQGDINNTHDYEHTRPEGLGGCYASRLEPAREGALRWPEGAARLLGQQGPQRSPAVSTSPMPQPPSPPPLPALLYLLPATWARFCDATHFSGMLGMGDRRYQKEQHRPIKAKGTVSNQGANPPGYFTIAGLASASAPSAFLSFISLVLARAWAITSLSGPSSSCGLALAGSAGLHI